ncbi:MAG TPA: hypothetical protein VIL30_10845 [Ramlibacter sp.]
MSAMLRAGWTWICSHGVTQGVYQAGLALLDTASAIAGWGADAMGRGGLVLALAASTLLAYSAVTLFPGVASSSLHKWFEALERELNRPSEAWSARTTHVFAWLTVPPIALVLATGLVFTLFGPTPLLAVVDGYGSRSWHGPLHAAALAYAVVFGALLALLAVAVRNSLASVPKPGDGPFTGQRKRFQRWFFRPAEEAVVRAQQVHPLIEQGEADLVADTAHMISVTDLRPPYAWSAFWTRASLWFVTTFGYFFFTEGKLGDAPGIQFSHWHIIDGGRRLLFCANFDGTFGGYLDDFIKGPSIGTTLFWRWTELHPRAAPAPGHPAVAHFRRFPRTRVLVFRGVCCEQQFKAYARESMVPHLFRYVAQNLTLEEKNRATQLRDALEGQRTDAKDEQVMRSLEP